MINEYLDSWIKKRIDYELQVKGKAKLNGDSWRKLRNYHLKSYVKQLQNPFAFLFHLKFKHKNIFKQISCANIVYYSELEKRNERMGLKKTESN
jgi:hypothetical protein